MKIVRFLSYRNKRVVYGVLKGEHIFPAKGDPCENLSIAKNTPLNFNAVKLLPPCQPSKIVLVGLNYTDHARELGMKIPTEPIIFIKPESSIAGPFDRVIYPKCVKRLDYEAELAVVVKKKCRNVPLRHARNYILGYSCLNDITARNLQKKDGQWTRAKSFDTFCPIGPCIDTDIDPTDLDIRLFHNGILRQSSNTKNLIFSVEKLIAFISGIMTLLPGDVISTGTPAGIGSMEIGDTVQVDIEGIGVLENYVA